MLFGGATFYKIFITADEIIAQNAMSQNPFTGSQQNIQAPVIEMSINCPKCGKLYPLYAKLGKIPPELEKQIASKSRKFPVDNRIECDCGFTFDLAGIRNQIENQFGRKIVN
jgi:hypothetical protein